MRTIRKYNSTKVKKDAMVDIAYTSTIDAILILIEHATADIISTIFCSFDDFLTSDTNVSIYMRNLDMNFAVLEAVKKWMAKGKQK